MKLKPIVAINLYLTLMATVLLSSIFSSDVRAQTGASTSVKETKTESMLKEIKLTYRPIEGEKGFIVSYKGKEMKEIDLIVAEAEDAIAILVDVSAGRDVHLTPATMRKLLEFSVSFDYLKVGISDIGSIRVQSEQSLTISAKAFGEVLNQVAFGADEVAKILAPVRKKAATK